MMHWRGLEFICFGIAALCQLMFYHGQLLPCAPSTLPVSDSWQSSTHQGTFIQRLIALLMGYQSIFSAKNAVDGTTTPGTISGACAQTKNEIYPWWQAQLDRSYYVTSIVMTSPESCDTCPEDFKLENILVEIGEVTVGYDNAGWNSEWNAGKHNCSFLSTGIEYSSVVVNCSKPIVGNFLRLSKLNTEETTLSLCEVEIVGYLNCSYSDIDPSVSATIVSTASAKSGDYPTSQPIRKLSTMHIASESVIIQPSTSSLTSIALKRPESSLSQSFDDIHKASVGYSAMFSDTLQLSTLFTTPSVVRTTNVIRSSKLFEELYTEGRDISSAINHKSPTTIIPTASINTGVLSLQSSFGEIQITSSETSYQSSSIIKFRKSSLATMTKTLDTASLYITIVSSSLTAVSASASSAIPLSSSQTKGVISSTNHIYASTHSQHPLLTLSLVRHSSTTTIPAASTKVTSQSVGELHTIKPSTSSVLSTALRTTESSLSHVSDDKQKGSIGYSAMSTSVVQTTNVISSSQVFVESYTEGQGISSSSNLNQQLTTTIMPTPSIAIGALSLQSSFGEIQRTSSDTPYRSSDTIKVSNSGMPAVTKSLDSSSYDIRTVSIYSIIESASATSAVAFSTSQLTGFVATPTSTPALVSWISSRYAVLSNVPVSFTSSMPRATTTLEDPSTLAAGVISSTNHFKLNAYSSKTLLTGSFVTVSSTAESSRTTVSSLFSQLYSNIHTATVTSTTLNAGGEARSFGLSPISVVPTTVVALEVSSSLNVFISPKVLHHSGSSSYLKASTLVTMLNVHPTTSIVEFSITAASSSFSQLYSDIHSASVKSTAWSTEIVTRSFAPSPNSVSFTEVQTTRMSLQVSRLFQVYKTSKLLNTSVTSGSITSLKTSSSITKLNIYATAFTYHASSSSSLSISSSSVIASIYSSVIPVWCPCTCKQAELIASFTNNNKTTEQVAEEIEEALSEMTVDSKTTSINERKLLSANDKRDSAKVIGTAGVVFCTTIIILVVLSDMPLLLMAVKGILRQQKG